MVVVEEVIGVCAGESWKRSRSASGLGPLGAKRDLGETYACEETTSGGVGDYGSVADSAGRSRQFGRREGCSQSSVGACLRIEKMTEKRGTSREV